MRRLPLLVLLFSLLSPRLYAQSFSNVDELLQLSDMDPLECEKTLLQKGFKFVETDGLESEYSTYSEYMTYEISPRRVHYQMEDRLFFLEVTSRLIKEGYVLTDTEGVLEDDEDTKVKAQKYVKGKFSIWLFTDEEFGETRYHVQIENSSPSSVKKSANTGSTKSEYKYKGDKDPIDFGYFHVGLGIPRGIIGEEPTSASTLTEDYTGQSGIGGKEGFNTGFGGVLGFTRLNHALPHGLDIGVILGGQLAMQPFSYEPLGDPYDDYTYNGFGRMSGGLGPCIALTPVRDADFKLIPFYKLEAAVAFGGTFEYIGAESFEQSLERDSESFAWVKTYGINMKAGGFFAGAEFSSYVDKGEFTLSQSVYDPNSGQYIDSNGSLEAALPIKQLTLKIGMAF